MVDDIAEAWSQHSDAAAGTTPPELWQPDDGPVVEVETRALLASDSPRISGENLEHARALANAAELPPIVVHRPTMRVIDGMHRLRAAEFRRQRTISARFFDGDTSDAFVLAVRTNIAHGLPLSLADRKAAAARIIASHPQWSDRLIASVSGLAPKTVSEIRKQADQPTSTQRRVGQDGRVRPVNSAEGRRRASELLRADPRLSLRQVAREAGISPETARNVRSRLCESPTRTDPQTARRRGNTTSGRTSHPEPDRGSLLARLRSDPALRFSETGRTLLRMLDASALNAESWEQIARNVPTHCREAIAHLALERSQAWKSFADRMAIDPGGG